MSKQTLRLSDVLEAAASDAVARQRADGSLPAGHNGPYGDPETPVRNTGHWLITFLHVYDQTDEQRFLDAAERAIEYLLSDDARPHGETFYHRDAPEKNSCNGLIGQAWSIEALAVAARTLDDPEPARVAERVFRLHPFDPSLGLWKRVEIDGSVLSLDISLNHQLWFAAAGALLAQCPGVSGTVERRVETFLDRLDANLHCADSGLIYHRVRPNFTPRRALRLARTDRLLFGLTALSWSGLIDNGVVRAVADSPVSPVRRAPLNSEALTRKSIGYQSFNLYALALLYDCLPDHEFWESERFQRTVDYVETDEYVRGLLDNRFGYPYNPPGIEVPFALETFRTDVRHRQRRWLSRQFDRCYDPGSTRLCRNTADPETLTARLYQATRLPDLEFSVELDSPA